VERFQKLLEALFFCPITKMLKAPSIEGAFSFQRHPYRGSHRGWGTGGGGRCLLSPLVSPIPGPSGASSATPN